MAAWVTICLSAVGARAQQLSDLAFMAGCWDGDIGGGTVIEEFYSTPSANVIVGTTRYLRDGVTRQYEIHEDRSRRLGNLVPCGTGGDRSPARFRLTDSGPRQVMFEDPAHDFPKRIIYRDVDDGSRVIRVDGGVGSAEVQEWHLGRVPC